MEGKFSEYIKKNKEQFTVKDIEVDVPYPTLFSEEFVEARESNRSEAEIVQNFDTEHREDRKYLGLLQEESVKFLVTADKKKFFEEFTGEINADGYLVDKEGNAFLLPSQCINVGINLVRKRAMDRYNALEE